MPGGQHGHGSRSRRQTVGVEVTGLWEQAASGEAVQQPLNRHHVRSGGGREILKCSVNNYTVISAI